MLFEQTGMVIKYIYQEATIAVHHDRNNCSCFQEPKSLGFNLAGHK